MKHLLKSYNPTEPDSNSRSNQFSSHSWWLDLNHFIVRSEQQFWMPLLSGLREEDVQGFIDDVVVNDIVIRGTKFPFLIFAGLRGTRPYTPARVLRQLGCKQVVPQTGDMRKFATDHQDGQVAFAKTIIREWRTRSVAGEKVPNRYHAECSDTYKNWLKENLDGTVKPGPNIPYFIKDVKAESQVLLHQLQEQYQENHLAH